MDDKIICLYAKGMTTRDIVATFKGMYGADISETLISKVTWAVIKRVIEWQSRPLDAINKAIYLALDVNMEGQKELLGMWVSENEGVNSG